LNDPERTGDYQPGDNDEPAAKAVPATQPQHIGRYRIEIERNRPHQDPPEIGD
jgi:hypothetical protein